MKDKIKVGFCVAYDWYLLEYALPLIYTQADLICLSLDADRISWSGNNYLFDELRFRELVKKIDIANKVIIIEEDYHIPTLTPMQNEVRQRNRIAHHMGKGGWHIQLDCDEYFLEFKRFVNYLRSLPRWKTNNANICCPWLVMFKHVRNGFLCIDPISKKNLEFMQIATRKPHYEYGRRNGNFNLHSNYVIVHQSWARSEQEIEQKIFNWGHSSDFEKETYYGFWRSVDETNYKAVHNFHWLQREAWPRLMLVEATTMDLFIRNFKLAEFPRYSALDLFIKNSKLISRIRALGSLLMKYLS